MLGSCSADFVAQLPMLSLLADLQASFGGLGVYFEV